MAKKNNEQPESTIVFGVNPVVELLKAKRRKVYMIGVAENAPRGWSQIEPLLKGRFIQVVRMSRDRLAQMSEVTDHQGIIAQAQPFPFIKNPFDPKKSPFLILLDCIQDTRNLGAILRSAYCTGVDGVILVKKHAAPLNAVALKASAGLAEYLPIREVSSSETAAQELRAAGYKIFLATFGGPGPEQFEFNEPLCVVVGSEGEGISSGLLSSGQKLTLPQRVPGISYNASVAAGILLFTIASKRKVI